MSHILKKYICTYKNVHSCKFILVFQLISRPFYCLYSRKFSLLRSFKVCHPLLGFSSLSESFMEILLKFISSSVVLIEIARMLKNLWLMKTILFHFFSLVGQAVLEVSNSCLHATLILFWCDCPLDSRPHHSL